MNFKLKTIVSITEALENCFDKQSARTVISRSGMSYSTGWTLLSKMQDKGYIISQSWKVHKGPDWERFRTAADVLKELLKDEEEE